MAFADSKTAGAFVSFNDKTGLWALHETSGQYRAWRAWLNKEFGVRGFSRWITATSEWPPTSQLGANRYAEFLSGIRDENKNPEPVPRNPNAWDGRVPQPERERVERHVSAEEMQEVYRKYGLHYMLNREGHT